MKNKWVRFAAVAAVACALLIGVTTRLVTSSSPHAAKAAGNFNNYASLSSMQKRLISGFVSSELDTQKVNAANARQHNYFPTAGDDQCSLKIGSNIKVNQNCVNLSDTNLQGRAQANNETSIAIDPMNSKHIVASDNDYRRGDGNCIGAYSVDAGHTWNDTLVPMSFTSGAAFGAARQYWQAGGDTAVAWDTKGNVYFQCQMFQRGAPTTNNVDASSAIYVFRSTGNYGASWNFLAHPVIEYNDVAGSGAVLEDKPLMTVDNHVGSPFQDRIYDTYTEFAADGSAYIWESYSSDYGQTFSPRTLVSSTSTLCNNTFGVPTTQGTCNENQFSQPFTGPDGALYVAWANFNLAAVPTAPTGNAATTTTTGIDNHYQMLLAKSVDGGATFSAPVKVGDYFDLPDCAAYQAGADPGRSCVPEKGSTTNSIFRATNYPVGSVNPLNKSEVVVTYGSYINKNSNETNGCVPQGFSTTTGNPLYTGVKTAGACNNDILVSTSVDGGATFTGTSTDPRLMPSVNQSSGQKTTDQWWQWATFTSNGKLVVSYYDRQYGTDENTGYSDFSLSASKDVLSFATQRATSSSMPPPTQFSGLFFGDYTGLDATSSTAYPLWMDTRDPELFLCPGTGAAGAPPKVCTASATNASRANDQDIFVTALPVKTS